jgi:hypothetical protein
MGVDISPEEGDGSAHMPYSALQRIRKTLIEATIAHLEVIGERKLAIQIQKWIPKPMTMQEMMQHQRKKRRKTGASTEDLLLDLMSKAGPVDYTAVTKDDAKELYKHEGCVGAFFFTQHSDCDGEWDAPVALEISKWLETILAYIPDDTEEVQEYNKKKETMFPSTPDYEHITDLKEVFDSAKEHNCKVLVS